MRRYYYKGFTLIELLIVLVVFSFVVIVALRSYIHFLSLQSTVEARQELTSQSYFMTEKLQDLLHNYTIDYEEYFNRRMVGCDNNGDVDGISRFAWDVGINGYCDKFTHYGNRNSIGGLLQGTSVNSDEHRIYYCSTFLSIDEIANFSKILAVPLSQQAGFLQGNGCFSLVGSFDGWQSFGQYAAQFVDVQDDVDFVPGALDDDDDLVIGKGPQAITVGSNVKEVYLISKDGTRRIFLRRKLIDSGDRNATGGVGDVPTDNLYTIQMLQLRGFDAGHMHNFSVFSSSGVYDGVVDTRACDAQAGFMCGDSNRDGIVNDLDTYDSISSIYSGYVLPLHEDDGWVNLFDDTVTVKDRNISITPTIDPFLAWGNDDVQINPSMTLLLENILYGGVWAKKVPADTLQEFDITIQTSFAIKTFY